MMVGLLLYHMMVVGLKVELLVGLMVVHIVMYSLVDMVTRVVLMMDTPLHFVVVMIISDY